MEYCCFQIKTAIFHLQAAPEKAQLQGSSSQTFQFWANCILEQLQRANGSAQDNLALQREIKQIAAEARRANYFSEQRTDQMTGEAADVYRHCLQAAEPDAFDSACLERAQIGLHCFQARIRTGAWCPLNVLAWLAELALYMYRERLLQQAQAQEDELQARVEAAVEQQAASRA